MTTFRIWAPFAASRVDVVLDDAAVPMTPAEGGWWQVDADVPADTPYLFSIDNGPHVPDPRAQRLAHGVHGPAQQIDLGAFRWHDTAWAGRELADSIVYELHVGTFTPDGTLDSAIERLDDLVDLGITTVQLMPLNSFPGHHNWGYDGVGLYAVQESYGGPEALARFVDAAHGRGLAVYLDVVYNHLGPDGNHLGLFGPYFTSDHHTPWGSAVNLDGPLSDEVRAFLLDNLRWWLEGFRLDGLRLDAVHALKDEQALPILEEMAQVADAIAERRGYPAVLVAEDDRNDYRTTTPRSAGGLGITGQWADDIHHGLHAALTGEDAGYYADFAAPHALTKVLEGAFLHDGCYSSFRARRHGRPLDREQVPGWRFVASLQTHDQVGNRRDGARLAHLTSLGRAAGGAALLLTSPFTPMLFMGEEWAASTPWQFFTDHQDEHLAEAVRQGRALEFASHGWGPDEVPDPQARTTYERSVLRWSERTLPEHARMLAWYRALIALRRETPELRDPALTSIDVDWDAARGLAVVRRGAYRVVVNLAPDPVELPIAGEILLAWDDTTTLDDALHLPGESSVILRTR